MIPKSKRKTIDVNGTKYEYCVTGYVAVFIKNLTTMEEIHWHQEVKPKWKTPVTPRDIRELIVIGSLWGTAARDKNWKKI